MRSFLYLIILTMLFASGCAGTLQEVVTCDPPRADIYWGKTEAQVKKTVFKTPHSRTISGSNWEPWCYQVKKDGYHDSGIICREEEVYRYLDFRLLPIKTTITSEPPNAIIYWGPSEGQLERTEHRTPRTITAKEHAGGASWKDWYFQVKKNGYDDSELVFLPQQTSDRRVHFNLIQQTLSKNQITLTWEDKSSDEFGFKIERKIGLGGIYHEIGTVGPNVTSYADTDLELGTIYYYRVRAYNSDGYLGSPQEMSFQTFAY